MTLPQQPDQVWFGSSSYIHTGEGFLYFSIWLDLFTRKVVGYSMNGTMKMELVLEAFHMAMGSQNIAPGQLTNTLRQRFPVRLQRVLRDYETSRYQEEHVAPRKLLGSLCC